MISEYSYTNVFGGQLRTGADDLRPGLLKAAEVLDGYLVLHPDCLSGRDIYHLMHELRYMADNPDGD